MKEKQSTSSIFIFNKKEGVWRLLLVHHKKFDRWMIPGGHVEDFENQYEAALRETSEETGLDIKIVTIGASNTREFGIFDDAREIPLPSAIVEEDIPEFKDKPAHYHTDFLYTAVASSDQITLAEKESNDIKWFSYEDLEELNLFDSTRYFAKRFFKGIEEEDDYK